MKNNLKNTIKKKFQLGRKKLIENPLKILKKINIEKLSEITSLSLKEKYKNFKKRSEQKEQNKIKLLKEENSLQRAPLSSNSIRNFEATSFICFLKYLFPASCKMVLLSYTELQ